MAFPRTFRPLLSQASRVALRSQPSRAPISRRFLNTDTAPVLYTAHATVVGARNGHIEAEGLVTDLAMPKSLGGQGGATNPEELFAAGYGACFQSAMSLAATMLKIELPQKKEDNIIETDVHMVGDMKKLDLGIRVDMKVKVKGVSKEDLERLVEKTKEVCPYSRATQGNVTTKIEVVST